MRVVQHLELLVVRPCSLVEPIELLHALSWAAQAFNNEHPELAVHNLVTAKIIQPPVNLLLLRKLLGVQVARVFQVETFQVYVFKGCLYRFYSFRLSVW